MKSKASGFYADSLEMLLDTMCNVLGAIVFITLALAALAPSSHAPAPEELQRQATELTNTLAAVTASNALIQAELEQTLLRLQEPRQQFQTNRMHLPNVSRTTRQPWPVIVRYGRVFPLYLFSSTARDGKAQNAQTIEWQRVAGKGLFVEPRWGQGDDPESGVEQIVRTFRSYSKTNYYFVFSVYEDSFAAFNRAKETAASLGFQYGWDPVAQNTKLQLGSHSESIPPQN
jgi:hypothetical protein